jgi:hypothetical protein
LPDLEGLEGAPVRYLSSHGLAAAFAEVPQIDPQLSRVLEFEGVVEALHSAFSIIPVRFGSSFLDLDKLQHFLEKNAAELTKLLDHLKGKDEMGIRVLAKPRAMQAHQEQPGEPENPGTGRQYLVAKRAIYEAGGRRSEQEKEIILFLERHFQDVYTKMKAEAARDDTSAMPGTSGAETNPPRLLISTYFLVPRTCLEAFREKFAWVSFDGAKFLLSGPWPPYNFADFQLSD